MIRLKAFRQFPYDVRNYGLRIAVRWLVLNLIQG